MPVTIRKVLISGLFVSLTCLSAGHAEAARRRAILGTHMRAVPVRAVPVRTVPAPVVVSVAVPGGVVAAPAVVPMQVAPMQVATMPVGSLATVRDFPRGVAYGSAYRMATPVMGPATPWAMRRVVRYGRSDFVGPRGYSAVVSPWPLIPVTTSSKPYGVGVVPPGRVVAWQSPAGYFYRSNYQSPVMQSGPSIMYPQQPGVEVVPPGSLELPLEPIPAPPAESGPQF